MSGNTSNIEIGKAKLEGIPCPKFIHTIAPSETGLPLQKFLFGEWKEQTNLSSQRKLILVSPSKEFCAQFIRDLLPEKKVTPESFEYGDQGTMDGNIRIHTQFDWDSSFIEDTMTNSSKENPTCLVLHDWFFQTKMLTSKEIRNVTYNHKLSGLHILSVVSDPVPFPRSVRGKVDYVLCSPLIPFAARLETYKSFFGMLSSYESFSLILDTFSPGDFIVCDNCATSQSLSDVLKWFKV